MTSDVQHLTSQNVITTGILKLAKQVNMEWALHEKYFHEIMMQWHKESMRVLSSSDENQSGRGHGCLQNCFQDSPFVPVQMLIVYTNTAICFFMSERAFTSIQ